LDKIGELKGQQETDELAQSYITFCFGLAIAYQRQCHGSSVLVKWKATPRQPLRQLLAPRWPVVGFLPLVYDRSQVLDGSACSGERGEGGPLHLERWRIFLRFFCSLLVLFFFHLSPTYDVRMPLYEAFAGTVIDTKSSSTSCILGVTTILVAVSGNLSPRRFERACAIVASLPHHHVVASEADVV
jgi:hypothetical protein